jgi:hypothetical protein
VSGPGLRHFGASRLNGPLTIPPQKSLPQGPWERVMDLETLFARTPATIDEIRIKREILAIPKLSRLRYLKINTIEVGPREL